MNRLRHGEFEEDEVNSGDDDGSSIKCLVKYVESQLHHFVFLSQIMFLIKTQGLL